MSVEKFKLLLWKHYRLRLYHWIMTIAELVFPIMLALYISITLMLNHQRIENITETDIMEATYPESYNRTVLLNSAHGFTIAYTPAKNEFVSKLMGNVKAEIDSISSENVVPHKGQMQLKPMNDEATLETFVANLSEGHQGRIMGLVFYNLQDADQIPDKLTYTLRDCEVWYTNDLYHVHLKAGPSYSDPYRDHGFAAVQMLINERFIQMKTNETYWNNNKPYFQPFPYPEYEKNDIPRETISFIVQFCVILSLLAYSIPFISEVIEEKDSGFKELMRLTGLPDWMIWMSWFVNGFIISLISFTIFAIIIKIPFAGPGTEAIHFVTFPVLWIMIMLYSMANISYCFMFCAIFHKGTIAASVFILSSIAVISGVYYISEINSSILAILSCLFPLGALIKAFIMIRYFELLGIVSNGSSLLLKDNNSNSTSLLFSFFMLIFDTFLYSLLTLYIVAINPGKFGTKKSPLFIFERFFPRLVKRIKAEPPKKVAQSMNPKFVESLPNLKVTIQMKDLFKHYGSIHAVDGINLNIYKGEITTLLGHNGAGKTTTMSLITGLTSPTSGTIYYKGTDLLESMKELRKNLGKCPQENRLLPYLSVMDHLLLFGMLKGQSKNDATTEANDYLTLMEMHSRKSFRPDELSRGMKRKLCLSISLMGKADTLILDEPTSGMDRQSKNKIWKLLLDMRENRTIILSTHHMEEADALGGRIAVLQHGRIVCHGRPAFLKRAYSTGYKLTITKNNENENSGEITQAIQSAVQGAIKEQETAAKVIYKLPITETTKFPALFRNLESGSRLGIAHMDVAYTSLESVFLNVGGVSVHDSSKDSKGATVGDATRDLQYFNLIKGIPLIIQQTKALFKKKYLHATRDLVIVITQIILPSLILAFVLRGLKHFYSKAEPVLDLSLNTYPNAIVMLMNMNYSNSSSINAYTDYVMNEGANVVQSTTNQSIVEELLDFGRNNILTYRRNLIVAAEMGPNITTSKVMYNLWIHHSFPVAITMYSNALLKSIYPNSSIQIKSLNHPVLNIKESCAIGPTMETYFRTIWIALLIALAFFTVDILASFVEFTNKERIDGFMHIQMMSGVSSLLNWIVTFIFDYVFYILIVAARIILFKIIDDHFMFLEFGAPLGALLVVILAFGISGLLFVYVISLLFNYRDSLYGILLVLNAISAIFVISYYEYELQHLEKAASVDEFKAKYLILLVPPFNFYLLFIKILHIWEHRTRCSFCLASMKPACEDDLKKYIYLEYPSKENPYGLLLGLEYLFIDVAIYAILLLLISTGVGSYFFNVFKGLMFHARSVIDEKGDSDVRQEYERVQEIKADESKMKQVSLLVDGLHKKYIKWFRPFTAIADVHFVVEPGKCFGLYGVNNAGKTTTMKILTAEIFPTKGNVYIQGTKLGFRRMQYLSVAGYCAATNCFIEELSGREMLTLVALLKGVSKNDVKFTVDKWLSVLDMEEYQDIRSGNYSGGNKRKLCAALALIGNPTVVFLDEPTIGVDPVSRRKLYDVIGQSKAAGQSVVLASHSVEECEALCDRLTIMVHGVMKCIGTAQHLRKRYAQGFSALIKINDNMNLEKERSDLKKDMMNVFTAKFCVLEEDRPNLLRYDIKNTSLLWSALFDKMEGIKKRNEAVIEEYVLTDTTLEDVFILFSDQESKLSK